MCDIVENQHEQQPQQTQKHRANSDTLIFTVAIDVRVRREHPLVSHRWEIGTVGHVLVPHAGAGDAAATKDLHRMIRYQVRHAGGLISAHTHTHTHTHTQHIHTYMNAYTYTHTCKHTHNKHTYMHTHAHTHKETNTQQTYTHTHTHTHTDRPADARARETFAAPIAI